MPKRQKESKLLPGEGRPTGGLNLGDFLVPSKSYPANNQNNFPSLGVSQSDDFPSLGSSNSKHASAEKKSPTSCWGAQSTPSNPQIKSSDKELEQSCTLPSTSISEASASAVTTKLQYSIAKTKKGSVPIRLENRNKGKKVTVIFNVSGDAKELLKELKHAAGCGGVIKDDTVELQGEKVDLVEKFVRNKMNWKK